MDENMNDPRVQAFYATDYEKWDAQLPETMYGDPMEEGGWGDEPDPEDVAFANYAPADDPLAPDYDMEALDPHTLRMIDEGIDPAGPISDEEFLLTTLEAVGLA